MWNGRVFCDFWCHYNFLWPFIGIVNVNLPLKRSSLSTKLTTATTGVVCRKIGVHSNKFVTAFLCWFHPLLLFHSFLRTYWLHLGNRFRTSWQTIIVKSSIHMNRWDGKNRNSVELWIIGKTDSLDILALLYDLSKETGVSFLIWENSTGRVWTIIQQRLITIKL